MLHEAWTRELAAARKWGAPVYETVSRFGLHHAPTFRIKVSLRGAGDAAWAQAPVISDFVQKIPVEGAAPGFVTEVRRMLTEGVTKLGGEVAHRQGVEAFLVGESLLRSEDPEDALRALTA